MLKFDVFDHLSMDQSNKLTGTSFPNAKNDATKFSISIYEVDYCIRYFQLLVMNALNHVNPTDLVSPKAMDFFNTYIIAFRYYMEQRQADPGLFVATKPNQISWNRDLNSILAYPHLSAVLKTHVDSFIDFTTVNVVSSNDVEDSTKGAQQVNLQYDVMNDPAVPGGHMGVIHIGNIPFTEYYYVYPIDVNRSSNMLTMVNHLNDVDEKYQTFISSLGQVPVMPAVRRDDGSTNLQLATRNNLIQSTRIIFQEINSEMKNMNEVISEVNNYVTSEDSLANVHEDPNTYFSHLEFNATQIQDSMRIPKDNVDIIDRDLTPEEIKAKPIISFSDIMTSISGKTYAESDRVNTIRNQTAKILNKLNKVENIDNPSANILSLVRSTIYLENSVPQIKVADGTFAERIQQALKNHQTILQRMIDDKIYNTANKTTEVLPANVYLPLWNKDAMGLSTEWQFSKPLANTQNLPRRTAYQLGYHAQIGGVKSEYQELLHQAQAQKEQLQSAHESLKTIQTNQISMLNEAKLIDFNQQLAELVKTINRMENQLYEYTNKMKNKQNLLDQERFNLSTMQNKMRELQDIVNRITNIKRRSYANFSLTPASANTNVNDKHMDELIALAAKYNYDANAIIDYYLKDNDQAASNWNQQLAIQTNAYRAVSSSVNAKQNDLNNMEQARSQLQSKVQTTQENINQNVKNTMALINESVTMIASTFENRDQRASTLRQGKIHMSSAMSRLSECNVILKRDAKALRAMRIPSLSELTASQSHAEHQFSQLNQNKLQHVNILIDQLNAMGDSINRTQQLIESNIQANIYHKLIFQYFALQDSLSQIGAGQYDILSYVFSEDLSRRIPLPWHDKSFIVPKPIDVSNVLFNKLKTDSSFQNFVSGIYNTFYNVNETLSLQQYVDHYDDNTSTFGARIEQLSNDRNSRARASSIHLTPAQINAWQKDLKRTQNEILLDLADMLKINTNQTSTAKIINAEMLKNEEFDNVIIDYDTTLNAPICLAEYKVVTPHLISQYDFCDTIPGNYNALLVISATNNKPFDFFINTRTEINVFQKVHDYWTQHMDSIMNVIKNKTLKLPNYTSFNLNYLSSNMLKMRINVTDFSLNFNPAGPDVNRGIRYYDATAKAMVNTYVESVATNVSISFLRKLVGANYTVKSKFVKNIFKSLQFMQFAKDNLVKLLTIVETIGRTQFDQNTYAIPILAPLNYVKPMTQTYFETITHKKNVIASLEMLHLMNLEMADQEHEELQWNLTIDFQAIISALNAATTLDIHFFDLLNDAYETIREVFTFWYILHLNLFLNLYINGTVSAAAVIVQAIQQQAVDVNPTLKAITDVKQVKKYAVQSVPSIINVSSIQTQQFSSILNLGDNYAILLLSRASLPIIPSSAQIRYWFNKSITTINDLNITRDTDIEQAFDSSMFDLLDQLHRKVNDIQAMAIASQTFTGAPIDPGFVPNLIIPIDHTSPELTVENFAYFHANADQLSEAEKYQTRVATHKMIEDHLVGVLDRIIKSLKTISIDPITQFITDKLNDYTSYVKVQTKFVELLTFAATHDNSGLAHSAYVIYDGLNESQMNIVQSFVEIAQSSENVIPAPIIVDYLQIESQNIRQWADLLQRYDGTYQEQSSAILHKMFSVIDQAKINIESFGANQNITLPQSQLQFYLENIRSVKYELSKQIVIKRENITQLFDDITVSRTQINSYRIFINLMAKKIKGKFIARKIYKRMSLGLIEYYYDIIKRLVECLDKNKPNDLTELQTFFYENYYIILKRCYALFHWLIHVYKPEIFEQYHTKWDTSDDRRAARKNNPLYKKIEIQRTQGIVRDIFDEFQNIRNYLDQYDAVQADPVQLHLRLYDFENTTYNQTILNSFSNPDEQAVLLDRNPDSIEYRERFKNHELIFTNEGNTLFVNWSQLKQVHALDHRNKYRTPPIPKDDPEDLNIFYQDVYDKVKTPNHGIDFQRIYNMNEYPSSDIVSNYMSIAPNLVNNKGTAILTYGYSGVGKSTALFGRGTDIGILQSTLDQLSSDTEIYFRVYELYGLGTPYNYYWNKQNSKDQYECFPDFYQCIIHHVIDHTTDTLQVKDNLFFFNRSDMYGYITDLADPKRPNIVPGFQLKNKRDTNTFGLENRKTNTEPTSDYYTSNVIGGQKEFFFKSSYIPITSDHYRHFSDFVTSIDRIREQAIEMQGDPSIIIQRVKTTVNNPSSSRSILVYDFQINVKTEDGKDNFIPFIIYDLPGKEDVGKTFVDPNYEAIINNIPATQTEARKRAANISLKPIPNDKSKMIQNTFVYNPILAGMFGDNFKIIIKVLLASVGRSIKIELEEAIVRSTLAHKVAGYYFVNKVYHQENDDQAKPIHTLYQNPNTIRTFAQLLNYDKNTSSLKPQFRKAEALAPTTNTSEIRSYASSGVKGNASYTSIEDQIATQEHIILVLTVVIGYLIQYNKFDVVSHIICCCAQGSENYNGDPSSGNWTIEKVFSFFEAYYVVENVSGLLEYLIGDVLGRKNETGILPQHDYVHNIGITSQINQNWNLTNKYRTTFNLSLTARVLARAGGFVIDKSLLEYDEKDEMRKREVERLKTNIGLRGTSTEYGPVNLSLQLLNDRLAHVIPFENIGHYNTNRIFRDGKMVCNDEFAKNHYANITNPDANEKVSMTPEANYPLIQDLLKPYRDKLAFHYVFYVISNTSTLNKAEEQVKLLNNSMVFVNKMNPVHKDNCPTKKKVNRSSTGSKIVLPQTLFTVETPIMLKYGYPILNQKYVAGKGWERTGLLDPSQIKESSATFQAYGPFQACAPSILSQNVNFNGVIATRVKTNPVPSLYYNCPTLINGKSQITLPIIMLFAIWGRFSVATVNAGIHAMMTSTHQFVKNLGLLLNDIFALPNTVKVFDLAVLPQKTYYDAIANNISLKKSSVTEIMSLLLRRLSEVNNIAPIKSLFMPIIRHMDLQYLERKTGNQINQSLGLETYDVIHHLVIDTSTPPAATIDHFYHTVFDCRLREYIESSDSISVNVNSSDHLSDDMYFSFTVADAGFKSNPALVATASSIVIPFFLSITHNLPSGKEIKEYYLNGLTLLDANANQSYGFFFDQQNKPNQDNNDFVFYYDNSSHLIKNVSDRAFTGQTISHLVKGVPGFTGINLLPELLYYQHLA